MADAVLFFSSNADTMIATKALKDAGVASKLIPKPVHLAAKSNLCISIDAALESAAVAAIAAANVALGGVAK
ncbi:MAG: putative Se/S carrier-like protein [Vulcanimicrobiaceae bacterium]